MKPYFLLLISLVVWLAGGCRSLESSPEEPVPNFTSTLNATMTAHPTTKPIPSPTLTFVPTESTPVSTLIPGPVETIIAGSEPRVYSSQRSPDGKWLAEVLIYDCFPVSETEQTAYDEFKLTQTEKGIAQVIDTQLQSCGGLGAYGLAGLFWSGNSRYYYFTDAREGMPDGCGYPWQPPFIRLDVTSSETETLGGGARSGDGRKLATWQDQELVIWDIDSGEIARIPTFAKDIPTGPIAWSPDGESLAYTQFESPCLAGGASYVVRVDLSERRQTLLLSSDSPSFGRITWDMKDALILEDENGDPWRYRLDTGELQQLP